MKKMALGLFVAFAATISFSAGASAEAAKTDVTGVITENHAAVANADVTVTCNGNSVMDTTDAFGAYLATFPIADCPFGSIAKVTAKKDGKSGVASSPVHGITTKLNLALVHVAIPEYGMIGALIAGGAGMSIFAYMRRRQMQSQY